MKFFSLLNVIPVIFLSPSVKPDNEIVQLDDEESSFASSFNLSKFDENRPHMNELPGSSQELVSGMEISQVCKDVW